MNKTLKEQFSEIIERAERRRAELIKVQGTPCPELEILTRPLTNTVVARSFCSRCGHTQDLNRDKTFILLCLAKNGDMNNHLNGKIDWAKNYIQTNFCFICGEVEEKKVEIKNLPK